jgi:hypothetical protein
MRISVMGFSQAAARQEADILQPIMDTVTILGLDYHSDSDTPVSSVQEMESPVESDLEQNKTNDTNQSM